LALFDERSENVHAVLARRPAKSHRAIFADLRFHPLQWRTDRTGVTVEIGFATWASFHSVLEFRGVVWFKVLPAIVSTLSNHFLYLHPTKEINTLCV
jgi:hypothetical protein